MAIVFGAFELYHYVSRAVDALVEMRIAEEDINVLAQAEDIQNIEAVQLETSDDAHSNITARGTDNILDTLLADVAKVETTDAGYVLACGPTAREIIRRSTALKVSDTSLFNQLKKEFPKEEAGQFVAHIRDGGILLWVEIENSREKEIAGTMLENGAVSTHSLETVESSGSEG
ncbi:MAG: hypothetical protein GF401_09125 [Chitinivibrionales bacterium]|nr:hypothetical protein [Chitinivibrionales bacterium]